MRVLALACIFALIPVDRALAQYPFVPPPLACMAKSEGPGILAGIASTNSAELPHRKLAVLQFTWLPSGDAPDLAFSRLRDRLVTRLRDVRPDDIREYVGPAELRSDAPGERLVELATLGKQLNARHLLVGRVLQNAGGAEVFLEVFDAASGKRLWQTSRVVTAIDLLELEPALARLIAVHEFGASSIVDSVALSVKETREPLAYAHYVRGLAYLEDSTRLDSAIDELSAATAQAPTLAWSKLAIAYTLRAAHTPSDSVGRASLMRRAAAAADKAVSADPREADGWIARGAVAAGGDPQRLSASRVAYEHAVLLDPRSAEAHQYLGRALLLLGELGGAQSHLLRAVTLSPEEPTPLVDLGELLLNQHAYGQSCRALDLALSINPRLAMAYELRAMARLRRGEVRPAWIDAETGRRLGADVVGQAVAVIVDAAAHDTVNARTRIRALRRQVESKRRITANDGGYVALGLVAVGDRAGALDILERVHPRDAQLSLILHRPGFDSLWGEIRFRRLLEASGAGATR